MTFARRISRVCLFILQMLLVLYTEWYYENAQVAVPETKRIMHACMPLSCPWPHVIHFISTSPNTLHSLLSPLKQSNTILIYSLVDVVGTMLYLYPNHYHYQGANSYTYFYLYALISSSPIHTFTWFSESQNLEALKNAIIIENYIFNIAIIQNGESLHG